MPVLNCSMERLQIRTLEIMVLIQLIQDAMYVHFIGSTVTIFANKDTAGIKQRDYSHLTGNFCLHPSIHTQLPTKRIQRACRNHASTSSEVARLPTSKPEEILDNFNNLRRTSTLKLTCL